MSKDCWNQIGVMGNCTCPELEQLIHCRDCPVYLAANPRLAEHEATGEDRDSLSGSALANRGTNRLPPETTEVPPVDSDGDTLANGLTTLDSSNTVSVLIFRLGVEWFGLSAKLFREVTQTQRIHTVPHRSNQIFLGVVNVRGELLLCISLRHLLGLGTTDSQLKNAGKPTHLSPVVYQRMIVMAKDGNSWVFVADEVYGIERLSGQELQHTAAVNAKSINAKSNGVYTQALIKWKDGLINLLDDRLLFYTLDRRIL